MKDTLTHEKFSVALSLCQVTLHLVGPVLSLLLVLNFSPAHAWGAQGRQVIAGLALAQLTLKVRIEVDRLLAQQPGETLISISMWADEHKNPITARWHYVNFPRDTCNLKVRAIALMVNASQRQLKNKQRCSHPTLLPRKGQLL